MVSLWLLEASGCIADEQAVIAIKKIWELEKIVYDSAVTPDGWGAARLHLDMAKLYARLNNKEEAIKYLKIAAEKAKVFDRRPEEQTFSSMLLGNIISRKIDFETADTRMLCEIMRDKWLSCSEFDKIRDTNEFKEIINILY